MGRADSAEPSPPRLPGSAVAVPLFYALGKPQQISRIIRRRGDAIGVRVPGFGDCLVISSPTLAKQVFTAPADVLHFGEKNPLARMLGDNSIFSLDEDEHLRERRLLLPPFHGARLSDYAEVFEQEALAEMSSWPQGREFATLEPMMRITLNAILRTVFGARGEELDGLRAVIPPLVKLGSLLTAMPWLQHDFATWSPLARFSRHRARFDQLVDRLIEQAAADPTLAERSDVLALLLQARYDDGEAMTRDQIADELLTVLVAGHETTATTLAWTIERLRRHPALLAELVAEAKAGEGKLREATIWEVQRTRPVITTTDRMVVRPFELGQWKLQPKLFLVINILGIHNDPELFPAPERFNPRRFLEASPETYSWLPFGGGRRRCIGAAFAKLEMDVVLRTLLTRCEWVAAPGKDEGWRFRGVAFAPARGGVAHFASIDWSPAGAGGSALDSVAAALAS